MPNSRPAKFPRHPLASILVAIALLFAASVMAQRTQSPGAPKYDAQTETKIKCTVDEVKLPSGAKEIVYLSIKTGTDPAVAVFVCPKSFMDDMGISFAKGDQITLTGSKVKQGDADLILAREIVKGTDTLVFRDDKGKPVWG